MCTVNVKLGFIIYKNNFDLRPQNFIVEMAGSTSSCYTPIYNSKEATFQTANNENYGAGIYKVNIRVLCL